MTAAPEPFVAYACGVAARLPAAERDDTAAELLDHLITDYERHLYRGTGSAEAIAAGASELRASRSSHPPDTCTRSAAGAGTG